jgi:hypothetical protein
MKKLVVAFAGVFAVVGAGTLLVVERQPIAAAFARSPEQVAAEQKSGLMQGVFDVPSLPLRQPSKIKYLTAVAGDISGSN